LNVTFLLILEMVFIMSKERELLKRFMTELKTEEDVVSLFNDIKECLALPEQTEQEPVAWMVETHFNNEPIKEFHTVKPMERTYKYDVVIPLYTAPPKREPLSDYATYDMFRASKQAVTASCYWAGIRDAEKAHGITGVDDE
jgi:hypothetical protein